MSDADFECGWFADRHGVNWFCAMRGKTICCEGRSGYFTAASPDTFKRWGWERMTREQVLEMEARK